VYTAASPVAKTVRDSGGDATAAEVPSFLKAGETLAGFGYDPFTDHFFLRLVPGDRFRVVDRPAQAVKREFTAPGLALPAGRTGDLAIRPRDGHVFVAHASEPAVIECNRFGETVRTFRLTTLTAPPAGLAYDAANDTLLALSGGDLARVSTHAMNGDRKSAVALDRDVALTTLAYDPEKRELYAFLAKEPAVGVFDHQGRLVRTLPSPAAAATGFIDVGPRSFLRLF
jgi:hypothetical protein